MLTHILTCLAPSLPYYVLLIASLYRTHKNVDNHHADVFLRPRDCLTVVSYQYLPFVISLMRMYKLPSLILAFMSQFCLLIQLKSILIR